MVHLDHLEYLQGDNLVNLDHKEMQDHLENQDHQEVQVKKELMELVEQEYLGQK